MLTDYIQTAMGHAECQRLPEDALYYCEIPELPGVWASGGEEAATRAELREVLEECIALGLAMRQSLPAVDGIEITVEFVR